MGFDWNGLGMAAATAGTSTEGETLEDKIDRFVNNKETITEQGSPMIYMERSEGINKAYNFRTDRFEVAIEAMDKVAKSYAARREERGKVNEELKNSVDTNENGGAGQ